MNANRVLSIGFAYSTGLCLFPFSPALGRESLVIVLSCLVSAAGEYELFSITYVKDRRPYSILQ